MALLMSWLASQWKEKTAASGRRAAALCMAGLASLLMQGCATAPAVAYVSNADSKEISVLELDRTSGAVKLLQTVPVAGTVMPLALSPDKRTLYAALRSEPYTLASFRIDGSTGQLTPLAQAALPDSMANVAADYTGRYLFAASYGGNKLSVTPLDAEGKPGTVLQTLPTGQNAHAAVPSPDNKHLFVTNLGSDQVMQLRLNAATGQLEANAQAAMPARPKAGPRHLVFHPGGRYAYLLNELDGGVDLLDYDAQAGTLALRKTWSTLPQGFTGKPWAADVHLTPDGRHLYTSERTSSTIAMWSIDPASGELSLLGHVPTEKQPRGFQIDPSGRWLLAVGQLSNALTSYRIDTATGLLTPMATLPVGKNPNWVEVIELR